MDIYFCLSWLLLLLKSVHSLNILAIYPYEGKSHSIVSNVLFKGLANKGHNVTVISHFPEQQPSKNYHDITLVRQVEKVEESVPVFEMSYSLLLYTAFSLAQLGINDCKMLASNEQVQDLVKSKSKFDVILLEHFNTDCALGIAHKIGGPIVATTTHVLMPYHFDRFGIPFNPSYVSFHFTGGGTKPTLLQRFERIIFGTLFRISFWITQKLDHYTLSQYFDDIPAFEEIAKEIKFLLLYHNFILTGSKLLPANVKEVGGYHVPEAKPLQGDLKKFVEEADQGVIYISFGSVINATSLPETSLQAIRGAMNEFPQRFIIKWDKNVFKPKKDKIYVEKWLPQVDILGHPKTLAFWSHSGMGSTTEAIHYGVPLVSTPLFGDQPSNAAAIEESGMGTIIQYQDLTKENLVAAFKKVLDPEFRAKVKEVSSAWHDRPRTPLDEAIFWAEFAARHPSLSYRSRAADVPFYQYLFLDLISIVLVVILGGYKLLRLCKGSRALSGKDKKNQRKQSKLD